jgi:hypothetical protein
MLDMAPRIDLTGAAAVTRGLRRMFARHQLFLLPEVPLRNGRRADGMGLDAKGQVVIVEIKCSRADLLGDQKWRDYLDFCDRFYWAVPPEMDEALLAREGFEPERTGLIVADAYDAAIVRQAVSVPLAAARRKKETERLARIAMRRHTQMQDPEIAWGVEPSD